MQYIPFHRNGFKKLANVIKSSISVKQMLLAINNIITWCVRFKSFVSDLQQPGGYKLLPAAPPRLHHPVKGQLRGTQNALTIRENGGV